MEYYLMPKSDELYHHGIKGQHWGRRRYQNADGSLTAAGRERYGSVENYNSARAKTASRLKTAAKVAGGAALVGGAAYLGYRNRGAIGAAASKATSFRRRGVDTSTRISGPTTSRASRAKGAAKGAASRVRSAGETAAIKGMYAGDAVKGAASRGAARARYGAEKFGNSTRTGRAAKGAASRVRSAGETAAIKGMYAGDRVRNSRVGKAASAAASRVRSAGETAAIKGMYAGDRVRGAAGTAKTVAGRKASNARYTAGKTVGNVKYAYGAMQNPNTRASMKYAAGNTLRRKTSAGTGISPVLNQRTRFDRASDAVRNAPGAAGNAARNAAGRAKSFANKVGNTRVTPQQELALQYAGGLAGAYAGAKAGNAVNRVVEKGLRRSIKGGENAYVSKRTDKYKGLDNYNYEVSRAKKAYRNTKETADMYGAYNRSAKGPKNYRNKSGDYDSAGRKNYINDSTYAQRKRVSNDAAKGKSDSLRGRLHQYQLSNATKSYGSYYDAAARRRNVRKKVTGIVRR